MEAMAHLHCAKRSAGASVGPPTQLCFGDYRSGPRNGGHGCHCQTPLRPLHPFGCGSPGGRAPRPSPSTPLRVSPGDRAPRAAHTHGAPEGVPEGVRARRRHLHRTAPHLPSSPGRRDGVAGGARELSAVKCRPSRPRAASRRGGGPGLAARPWRSVETERGEQSPPGKSPGLAGRGDCFAPSPSAVLRGLSFGGSQ